MKAQLAPLKLGLHALTESMQKFVTHTTSWEIYQDQMPTSHTLTIQAGAHCSMWEAELLSFINDSRAANQDTTELLQLLFTNWGGIGVDSDLTSKAIKFFETKIEFAIAIITVALEAEEFHLARTTLPEGQISGITALIDFWTEDRRLTTEALEEVKSKATRIGN